MLTRLDAKPSDGHARRSAGVLRTRLLIYWVWQPFAYVVLAIITRPIEWVYRYHRWRETLRR